MELINLAHLVGIGYKTRNLRDLDMQAVHHFAVDLQDFFSYPIVPEELTQEEEESVVLIVDDYHDSPPERDWGGIGYSFVVFPSERVYEFGPLTQQRAGVGSHNHHVVSWCVAGDFTSRIPRSGALRAGVDLGKLIHDRLGLVGMPVKGHRYWGGTSCPGDTWKDWVPELEELIHNEEEDMKPPLYRIKDRPEVYYLAGGKLFHAKDLVTFIAAGYKHEDVQVLAPTNPIFSLPVEYPGGVPDELR